MSTLEKLKVFKQYYDFTFFERIDEGSKIYVGEKENVICRFCGRGVSDTSFSTVAHAVPEAIGNKRIVLIEECDECNQEFSQSIENSFDKYTKPFRIMGGIKGKQKVPSYKTRDKLARVDVDRPKNSIKVGGQSHDILTSDMDSNKHQIEFEREPYIPFDVYKAMLKMALSVLPNDRKKDFSVHFDWLMEREGCNLFKPYPILIERVCFGPSFGIGSLAALLIRREHTSIENPYALFVLMFGNVVLQISMPKSNEDIGNIPVFPIPSEEDGGEFGCCRSVITMDGIDWVKADKLVFGIAQKAQ